jgi:hypothetical protein
MCKRPQDRTSSELYLLEETIHDVVPIANLPLAKRMEICKNLGFLQLDSDTTVYNQGATGNIFYIVFTGSVRVRNGFTSTISLAAGFAYLCSMYVQIEGC